jgi:hypothetical protein
MARCAVLLAAAVLAGAAATPAVAAPEGPASGICVVKKVPNIKGSSVKVGVNIDEASSKAADRKARCGVVSRVVRKLARAQAERPMKAAGYSCTPIVFGANKVAWKCTWTGGSPRTSVELRFAYAYRAGS